MLPPGSVATGTCAGEVISPLSARAGSVPGWASRRAGLLRRLPAESIAPAADSNGMSDINHAT
jgi:hypothetical protein